MDNFYFSLAAGSQYKTAKILKYPHILINHQSQTHHRPTYEIDSLFVDCGGFSSSWKHGGYVNSDEDYLNYVKKVQPEYYALRDYPCEPELLKEHDRTVKQHQEMTLNNHLSLLDLIDNYQIDGTWLPVIQGWTIHEYLEMIDLYREYGIITDYMAVGSVCRRTSPKKIQRIISAIKQELPHTNLHGFGVKFSVLQDLATWNNLYSVDSGAWDYSARWEKLKQGVKGSELSLVEAEKYIKKIDYLRCFHQGQTSLIKI